MDVSSARSRSLVNQSWSLDDVNSHSFQLMDVSSSGARTASFMTGIAASRKADMRRPTSGVSSPNSPTTKGTSVALRFHGWALRMALERLHVLLNEHIFWETSAVYFAGTLSDDLSEIVETESDSSEADL